MNSKVVMQFIMAAIILGTAHGWAQTSLPASTLEGDALLKSYVGGVPGAKEKAELLVSQRLSITAENVKLVRSSLARKISDEERVNVLRLLGDLYSHDDASGMNAEIVSDLKARTASGSRPVARAATFALAHAGSNEDAIAILKQAKSSGVLNVDEYAAELGHALRWLPAERQLEALALVEAATSQYGNEALVMNLKDRALVDQATPEMLAALEQFLRRSEPNFPMAYSSYGVTTSFRYADWLHALALVSSKNGGRSYRDVALAALNDKRTDPRKILAFLSSQEGRELMASSGRAGFVTPVEKARQYAQSLPGNVVANDIANDLAAYFATVK